MSKKVFVRLIVAVSTTIAALLTTLYLSGCKGLKCNGFWCYDDSKGEVVIVR